jgi:hypothetical protein
MRKTPFYAIALMLSLSSCFGPNIHDIQSLAEKRYEYDLLTRQNNDYRFNNIMSRGAMDSWTDLQRQEVAFRTQKKLDEIDRDIMSFEKKYADKNSSAKLNELEKAAWVYETSGTY